MISINNNDIEIVKSRLKILKVQYNELISYDKGFKSKDEVEKYYTELGSLSSKIEALNNILIDNQERK